jgi:hypothetical protein
MDTFNANKIPHWVPPTLALVSILLFIGVVIWILLFIAGTIGEALEPQQATNTGEYPPIDTMTLERLAPRLDLDAEDFTPAPEESEAGGLEEDPEEEESEEPLVEEPEDIPPAEEEEE